MNQHVRELYDYWMQTIRRQSHRWHFNHFEKYADLLGLALQEPGWDTDKARRLAMTMEWRNGNRNRDGHGYWPQARLYERQTRIMYCGIYKGEPILNLVRYRGSSNYNDDAWTGFVLYPDGTFFLPTHWRGMLRMVGRHTFISTYRHRSRDYVHFNPENSGWSSWVNMRDWQVRKQYLDIGAMASHTPWTIEDDKMVVCEDPDIIHDMSLRFGAVSTAEWHIETAKTSLLAGEAEIERRYRMYHRKWAREQGLPDPYAVLSNRRQAQLAQIVQLVQPYQPARSQLLKPVPEESGLVQAPGGQ